MISVRNSGNGCCICESAAAFFWGVRVSGSCAAADFSAEKSIECKKKQEKMESGVIFTQEELSEAKRQNDSTLHKLRETIKTFEEKENVHRYKSQITLAKRRMRALEISNLLIEQQLGNFVSPQKDIQR